MSMLKHMMVGAALGAVTLAVAAPSSATVLIANTGWQYDQVDVQNAASENSPLTFTVAPGTHALFSLSDGFIAGDTYQVIIDSVISATSTFTLYSTPFVNNLGPAAGFFASDWLDTSFAHLQLAFDPGTYSLVVNGDGASGVPAGVGERLDVLGVPEPATWLTMLFGFGGMGLAMRKSRRKQALGMA